MQLRTRALVTTVARWSPVVMFGIAVALMGCQPELAAPSSGDGLLMVGSYWITVNGEPAPPGSVAIVMPCTAGSSPELAATIDEERRLFVFTNVSPGCEPGKLHVTAGGVGLVVPYVPHTVRAQGSRVIALPSMDLELVDGSIKQFYASAPYNKQMILDDLDESFRLGGWGSLIAAEVSLLEGTKTLLEKADAALESDKEAALPLLTEAWKLDPSDSTIQNKLVNLARDLGETALEQQVLQDQVAVTPIDTYPGRRLATLLESAGKEQEAMELLVSLVDLAPTDTTIVRALSDLYVKQGDVTAAKAVWKAFVAAGPEHAYGLYDHFYFQKSVGTPEVGIKALEGWVEAHPDDSSGIMNLAWAYKDQSMKAPLEKLVAKVKGTLSPGDYADLVSSIGGMGGSTSDSVASLEDIIQTMPDKLETYGKLATILIDQGKIAEADAIMTKAMARAKNLQVAVKASPGGDYEKKLQLVSFYGQAASYYGSRGASEEVKDVYERMIALDNSYSFAYDGLARLLAKEGHLDEAVALMKQALAEAPYPTAFYPTAGRFYLDHDMLDEAAAVYAKAMDSDGASYYSCFELGRIYAKQGKQAEAYALVDGCVTKYKSGYALSDAGAFYLDQGEYEKAKALLVEAIQGQDYSSSAVQDLVSACRATGDLAAAKAALAKAVKGKYNGHLVSELVALHFLAGTTTEGLAQVQGLLGEVTVDAYHMGPLIELLLVAGAQDQVLTTVQAAMAKESTPKYKPAFGTLLWDYGYETEAVAMLEAMQPPIPALEVVERLDGMYLAQGTPSKAEEAWAKLLATDTSEDAKLAHASFLSGIGQLQASIASHEAVIGTAPSKVAYWRSLAWLLIESGKEAEVDALLQKAAKTLSPKHLVQLQLYVAPRLGDMDAWLAAAKKLHDMEPTALSTTMELVKATLATGDTAGATSLLETMVTAASPSTFVSRDAVDAATVLDATALATKLRAKLDDLYGGSDYECESAMEAALVKGDVAGAIAAIEGCKLEFYKQPVSLSYDFHRRLAKLYLLAGDTTKAKAAVDAWLAEKPFSMEAMDQLFTIYVTLGDDAAAKGVWATCKATTPWSRCDLNAGLYEYAKGRYEAAEGFFASYLAAEPGSAWAYYYVAKAKAALGDLEGAKAVMASMEGKVVGEAKYQATAELAMRMGDWPTALEAIDAAQAINATSASLASKKADCLAATGDEVGAKTATVGAALRYLQWLKREPFYSSALNGSAWFGLVHPSETSSLDETVAEAKHAFVLSPLDDAALNTYSVALSLSGKAGEAIQLAAHDVALDPLDPYALLGLALAHAHQGDTTKAEALLAKAKSLEPLPMPDLAWLVSKVEAALQGS